jgi:hypothetical protein
MPQIALTQDAPIRNQTRRTKRERTRQTSMANGGREVSAASQADSIRIRSWSDLSDTTFLAVCTCVITYAWGRAAWWLGSQVLRWIW